MGLDRHTCSPASTAICRLHSYHFPLMIGFAFAGLLGALVLGALLLLLRDCDCRFDAFMSLSLSLLVVVLPAAKAA